MIGENAHRDRAAVLYLWRCLADDLKYHADREVLCAATIEAEDQDSYAELPMLHTCTDVTCSRK